MGTSHLLAMSLPDFSNADTLSKFESFLSSKSYIDGHEATQADVAVYEAIKSPVDSAKYPNISRWQEHIKSFEAEHASLKGDKSKAAELLNFSALRLSALRSTRLARPLRAHVLLPRVLSLS